MARAREAVHAHRPRGQKQRHAELVHNGARQHYHGPPCLGVAEGLSARFKIYTIH